MSSPNTQPANTNAISSQINELANKLAETKKHFTWAAIVFLTILAFLWFSFDRAFPQPTSGAPYKYETKLTIYLIHHLILLGTILYCLRKAVLFHSVAMDCQYKKVACELLTSALKIQADHGKDQIPEIRKQITHTALKIIAENPTRLLGSWEQELPDSTTAQRSDADSAR
jgi:hypothetical protein